MGGSMLDPCRFGLGAAGATGVGAWSICGSGDVRASFPLSPLGKRGGRGGGGWEGREGAEVEGGGEVWRTIRVDPCVFGVPAVVFRSSATMHVRSQTDNSTVGTLQS